MKKSTVILISAVLVISFLGLVYYGLQHSRGVPVAIEKTKRELLEVNLIDKDIDLSKGIAPEIWESLKPTQVELMYQLMVLPWPVKGLVPAVTVKAFHNNRDVYFYLAWKDDTVDKNKDIDKFTDGCAVMFPLDTKTQPVAIMMGFLGKSNIWHWTARRDEEYWLKKSPQTTAYSDFYRLTEDSPETSLIPDPPQTAVNDMVAIRVGTITAKETQNVQGRGVWTDGNWQVVFKRPLTQTTPEFDANFNAGNKLFALSVWNGEKKNRGGRKSISDWVELQIK